ncbi:MAG: cation-translocating P-type ATPase C-terminal domain-containing protein, partial [bacterium]|nr:cation-translocating P-type ATPase C-terminal domain-containing protein [bacterium]
ESNFEKPSRYLIDRLMTQRMFLMAASMMVFTLILFNNYYENDLTKAWTISLTVLAIFQWFNAWNCRSEKKSIFRMNPLSNKFMIIGTLAAFACQLLAVYHPFFQKFLHTTALDLSEWLIIISFAASIILVEEIRKYLSWRNKKSWSSSAPQLQVNQI